MIRRIFEHKGKSIKGFTDKYNVNKLVYFEQYNSALDAIEREKQLKAGSRQKKIDLINKMNPEWKDLFEWFVMNQQKNLFCSLQ